MIDVHFFQTAVGNVPVLEWLRNLEQVDRKVIGNDLRTVQIGWPIGMPLCRALGEGLFEVRSNISDKRIVRLIFFQHEHSFVIVEGFIKKTQTTPASVIKLAKSRKSEFERNGRKSKDNE